MEISITAMKSLKISVFLSVSLECSLLILNFCGKPRRRASGGAGYVLPVDKNRVALSCSGRCRTAQAKAWFFACLPACRQGYNADPRRRAAARRRRTPGFSPQALRLNKVNAPGKPALSRDTARFRTHYVILISNKMLYLKSRVFHTLVPHVPCVTPSHKNLTRLAL